MSQVVDSHNIADSSHQLALKLVEGIRDVFTWSAVE